MQVYHYDRLTGELCGQSTADLDPLEGKPLIPSHATTKKSPAKKADYVCVFDVLKSAWTQVSDNRGTVYDTTTKAEKTHTDLGPLPANRTKLKPASQDESWSGSAWVFDTVKAWTRIRGERDALIAASDWTQLADVLMTVAQKTAWGTYRQALRDVPLQAAPLNIVWPVKPV